MTLAGNVLRTVVLMVSASSILVACAPQSGMRSYRYDLTKYKAIQEKLHQKLDAADDSAPPVQAPAPTPTNDEAPDAGLNGGSLPADSQNGGDVEKKSDAAGADAANGKDEVNPEVQGQNIIETAVNEQIEGKTLSVESLDKLFDASKAQDAVLGLSANVTLLEGKMDIAFQAIAAPMKNSKEFSGAASPTLDKAGIANKILFAEVTGAESDGDAVSTELVGTLLCRDTACHDMIGMLVVEPNLMVVFKVDSTGKVEGPFKTFEEASAELAKSKAAVDDKGEATQDGEQQQGEAKADEAAADASQQADENQVAEPGVVDESAADAAVQNQKTDSEVVAPASSGAQKKEIFQYNDKLKDRNVTSSSSVTQKKEIFQYNDKLKDKNVTSSSSVAQKKEIFQYNDKLKDKNVTSSSSVAQKKEIFQYNDKLKDKNVNTSDSAKPVVLKKPSSSYIGH